MKFTYKDTSIYYNVIGNGEPIVFLHGWQSNSESFVVLAEELKWHYQIILLDFPPFGKSQKLNCAWSIDDYTQMVIQLLKILKVEKFNILAHSFGGRVAINLCCCYNCNVNKLILTGSAGLKPKRSLSYYFALAKYKLAKRRLSKKNKYFQLNNFGSSDYKNLDSIMKQTFVKIVNFHQDKVLKNIKCPTLIVFGENDNETPMYMAKRFHKLIKNSTLLIFKNCSHFCFLEQTEKFYDVVKNFLTK